MQTRKYPRTMQEAFGPYTDYRLAYKHVDRMHKHDKIVLWGCAITVVVVVGLRVAGIIP